MPGVKAKLARAFLNFLDEHGDYRTQLEEAAARAAAAEANSLFAKDRRGRKKKRRRGKLKDATDDADEEEWDELLGSSREEEEEASNNSNQLPDDPYEQIQFYFHTFKSRTQLQIEEQVEKYQTFTKNWMHDELHHPERVPILSGSMLGATVLLWLWRARSKRIARVARVHGILGRKLTLSDYLHSNLLRGRLLIQFSEEGGKTLHKMTEKASKAEEAALASMRPYQRKKYERFCKLEQWWEWCFAGCLIAGMVASGVTLAMSLNALLQGVQDLNNSNGMADEQLDGHIYSFDGPMDSDGYPIGMRELAEENYAACLSDAEENGIEDPTSVCDVNAFFEAAALNATLANEEVPSSPLRSNINHLLTTHLHVPSSLADYLTTLQSQTIAYLSSLVTFLLFLLSHYIAHKIHLATINNDPMKHFVLSATDKTVKADGTVEAKKGETEAQRKRRERMIQAERLKAKMAQLAQEAKQRVEERRLRIEGEAAAEKEKEEQEKKVAEEMEEIVKAHSRQFMMIKAGVPDGAILNSLAAEGFDDEEEAKEIIEQLKAVKARRAEEARKAEELEAKKLEEEKKEEEEKERIVAERLKMMKSQKSTSSIRKSGSTSSFRTSNSTASKDGGAELKKRMTNKSSNKSVDSASTLTSDASKKSKASTSTDPASAKSAMLGQIGQSGLKSSALRKTPSRIPHNPAPRPGSSSILSGNLPIGAKSDKRWDRDSKTWVEAAIAKSPNTRGSDKSPKTPKEANSPSARGTPKKSNTSEKVVKKIPSRLKLGSEEEEKKGEEDLVISPPRASPRTPAMTEASGLDSVSSEKKKEFPKTPDLSNDSKAEEENKSQSSSIATPVLVRISSPDDETPAVTPLTSMSLASAALEGFRRPSARDIQATITAVENVPDEEFEGDTEGEEENQQQEGEDVDLAPNWLHSPAFEMAVRSSNANWDRRPSSRDVIARIQAVEEFEQQNDGVEQEAEVQQQHFALAEKEANNGREQRHLRPRSRQQQGEESLAIIHERRNIDPATSFEFKRKSSKMGDAEDDEISELSEPTYVSNEGSALKGRSVPQALFVPSNDPAMSPMVHSVKSISNNLSPMDARRNIVTKEKIEKMVKLPDLAMMPSMPGVVEGKTLNDSLIKSVGGASEKMEEPAVVKVETEEEKKRRERSEARAKKMEAIAARREAGKDQDDDESAVSGLSKRHRLRRKKKKAAAALAAAPEETDATSQKSEDKSDTKSTSTPVKVETEEEKQRKARAAARAKKMESIAALREAGKDDGTAVTGISRRHRIRRKKSAIAAITPEEKDRNEWKVNIYASVLNAERSQWKKSIYSHVINAEANLAKNIEAKRDLEEQNAAAQRRAEHQKKLDKKAKKFAARAERFHKIRREGGGDDDASVGGSVVSSASKHRRRRRGRKSSSTNKNSIVKPLEEEETTVPPQAPLPPIPTMEEPTPIMLTAEEKEKQERDQWCRSIFTDVMQADQCKWQAKIYSHAIHAEEARNKRLELEEQIARDRAAHEARKAKERKDELRAKKIEKMKKIREDVSGLGNVALDDADDQSVVSSAAGSSSLQKMRNRRRKAARKSTAK